MKWVELSVQAHPEAVDAIAEVFRRHGSGGVAIEQPMWVDDEGEEQPRFYGLPVIRAYLAETDNEPSVERHIEEALWHLQAFNLAPVGTLIRREMDEEDWAEGWKEHFHPLKVGRVVIKPSWREWEPQSGEIVIELDPGMAFGTGLHPTTRLTLAALQHDVQPGADVLDLGTGSGILAMAAARLGGRVTALDVSEVAVDVARSNVESNGLAEDVRVGLGSIEMVRGRRFDLVLANIIASVLVELAHPLADSLLPDGILLASGIIDERVGPVREAFGAAGLTVDHQEREGDWWLLGARPST